MKTARMLVILVLALTGLGTVAFSQPGEQMMTARWAQHGAPVIDGVMGPTEWSAAIPFHVTFSQPTTTPGIIPYWLPSPDNPDDLSFTVYSMYDEENLYIAVDVADDIIIDDSPDDLPWFDDDVEIYVDGDQEGNDISGNGPDEVPGKEGFQLLKDVGGDSGTNSVDEIDWEAAPGFRPRGYVVEFRIALGSIDTQDGEGEAPPGPGSSVGFNVTVGDDDNGGLPYNWDPESDGSDSYGAWDGSWDTWWYAREDDWGSLYLEPLPPGLD
ncbi:MAG: hypothetical protein GTO24_17135 [candidate division Zixibacteria bacterium]|nr:hypothetical protein [candidate division Zixibacteria bacterium]